MTPDAVAPTNPVGSLATFGATGATLGQNISNQGNNAALQKAQIANLNAKTANLTGQQPGMSPVPMAGPGSGPSNTVQSIPIVAPAAMPSGQSPALDPTTGQPVTYSPWDAIDEESEYA